MLRIRRYLPGIFPELLASNIKKKILIEELYYNLPDFLKRFWLILSPTEKRLVLKKIKEKVKVLHQRGYIHGNLKPENILLFYDSRKFTVRLTGIDLEVNADIKKHPEYELYNEYKDSDLTDLKFIESYFKENTPPNLL